ncbi:hypothetical protein TNCV_984621 [Trichonephila clavipes]|nr:hypothetical protein TNCV_984621 [Trichonephila clavipes]
MDQCAIKSLYTVCLETVVPDCEFSICCIRVTTPQPKWKKREKVGKICRDQLDSWRQIVAAFSVRHYWAYGMNGHPDFVTRFCNIFFFVVDPSFPSDNLVSAQLFLFDIKMELANILRYGMISETGLSLSISLSNIMPDSRSV